MTNRLKPEVSPQQAQEIIGEVSAADREEARRVITAGVQMAQEKWIEAPLIAEALALELTAIARNGNASSAVVSYLRELADSLEAQPDYH